MLINVSSDTKLTPCVTCVNCVTSIKQKLCTTRWDKTLGLILVSCLWVFSPP